MTSRHCGISRAIWTRNCSDVLPTASIPSRIKRSARSFAETALATDWYCVSMSGAGVLAGAIRPIQSMARYAHLGDGRHIRQQRRTHATAIGQGAQLTGFDILGRRGVGIELELD